MTSPCTPLLNPLVFLCCRPIYPSAIVEGDGHQEHILLARRLQSPGLYCTCSMFWNVRPFAHWPSIFVILCPSADQGASGQRGSFNFKSLRMWWQDGPALAVWHASPGPNKAWSSRSWTNANNNNKTHTVFLPKVLIQITDIIDHNISWQSYAFILQVRSLTSCLYVYIIYLKSHK